MRSLVFIILFSLNCSSLQKDHSNSIELGPIAIRSNLDSSVIILCKLQVHYSLKNSYDEFADRKEALEHGLRSKSIDHTLPTAKIENRIKENFFKIAELILTDTHITSLEIKNISLIRE
ncbi:MAG: hypothetical protein KDK41_07885 [Leptospiraceae bacterium]|nr:hypothetical protein [Leptospiraceae bacterium]